MLPAADQRGAKRGGGVRWGLVVLAACGVLGACKPSREQVRFQRAMYGVRYEPCPDYRDGIAVLESHRQAPKEQNEFVQYGMCETTLAVLGGNYGLADEITKHAHLAVARYQDANSETRAAMGNEAVKFFKGEPHERALLCFYAGLVCYANGAYNDARVFFMQALLATATRDDDMAAFREDFALGHFWLGRAYLKLEQDDNARIAFRKAAARLAHKNEDRELKAMRAARTKAYKEELRSEAAGYKQGSKAQPPVAGIADLSRSVGRAEMPATLPDAADADPTEVRAETAEAFLDIGFQKQANLIIVGELGCGPLKYLTGSGGALDEFRRMDYKERSFDVYVDGYRSGPAFELLDTYHQAVTRGVKTRRGRQTGKAVTKEILTRVPLVGSVAGYWDIQADARYWTSLPGEYHVYAARVTPGLHTISLKCYDINDRYLPRFDVTRHFIVVPAEGEVVLVLNTVENQDNAYALTQPAPQ
jgi:tetratricopeptide (TPR) repeat protein